jgi:phosphate-selective porin OprO and OprP
LKRWAIIERPFGTRGRKAWFGFRSSAFFRISGLGLRVSGRSAPLAFLVLLAALGRVGASGAEVPDWTQIEKTGLYPLMIAPFAVYHNESNAAIQAFAINTVYQGQYWTVDAKQGNASGWENRRIYIGGSAEFLHQFNVQAMVKISDTFDPVYDGLHTAILEWKPDQSVSVSVGRLDYLSFAGPEHSASSTRLSTFELGLLVNQLAPTEIAGALLQGKEGRLSGNVGLVSGSTTKTFTDFAGGFGVLAGVSYDLPLFYDSGSINLDYVFNNGNPSNNALKPYDHVLSLWHQGRVGPLGVGLQLIGAHGLGDHPAVFGVTAQAAWLCAKDVFRKGDAFQAVLRYQYAVSDGDNGLNLQQRYEQEVVPGGVGNAYNAVYVGLNYLLHGNQLKLMNGVEYSVMQDSALGHDSFNGWTFITGVRLYF